MTKEMPKIAKSVHPRMIFGLTLVVIGFFYLLESYLPYRYRFDIGDFWPLIFVFWGVARFSVHGARGWAFSATLMTLGAIFFLNDYYPFSYLFDWDNIWPLAMILLGGYLITKNLNRQRAHQEVSDPTATENLRVTTFLGSHKSVINSPNFSGGNVTVVLGGHEIDCTQAKLNTATSQVVIDVTTMMGGVELMVPADWSVELRATAFLGGIEDKRSQQVASTGGTTLVIDGVVVLAGVEIVTAK